MAFAVWLMRTKLREIIMETKNLHNFDDLYPVGESIPKVFGRALVIKDANLFHIFPDGIFLADHW